jgi:phage shock protein C
MTTAAATANAPAAIARARVHSHPETILGTCQAIGDDLGFSPYWLRAVFGIALVWNMVAALAAYAALTLLVGLLHWRLPDEREAAAEVGHAVNDASPADTRVAA